MAYEDSEQIEGWRMYVVLYIIKVKELHMKHFIGVRRFRFTQVSRYLTPHYGFYRELKESGWKKRVIIIFIIITYK